jgi:hypothetical protein
MVSKIQLKNKFDVEFGCVFTVGIIQIILKVLFSKSNLFFFPNL